MSGTQTPTGANPNVPDVSNPVADINALTACMRQVRLGLRSLAGIAGPLNNRAVTFDDLNTGGLTAARIAALEARVAALENK